jgi:hypothetical protein
MTAENDATRRMKAGRAAGHATGVLIPGDDITKSIRNAAEGQSTIDAQTEVVGGQPHSDELLTEIIPGLLDLNDCIGRVHRAAKGDR